MPVEHNNRQTCECRTTSNRNSATLETKVINASPEMNLSANELACCLASPRTADVRVHCITNYVTANDVANMLYACGAKPILADEPLEVAEVTSHCDALCLNMGTLNETRLSAMLAAGKRANELGHPVVLDPVGVGASAFRKDAARTLLREVRFAAIRGNASEIKTLAALVDELLPRADSRTLGVDSHTPGSGTQGKIDKRESTLISTTKLDSQTLETAAPSLSVPDAKGMDATGVETNAADAVTEANLSKMASFAKAFAEKLDQLAYSIHSSNSTSCSYGLPASNWSPSEGQLQQHTKGQANLQLQTVVAITGAIDLVADAKQCIAIYNGQPDMAKVTGTGCQLTSLVAAFLGAATKARASGTSIPDPTVPNTTVPNTTVTDSTAPNLTTPNLTTPNLTAPDTATTISAVGDTYNANLLATTAAVCTMCVAGEIAVSRQQPGDGNATLRNRIIDAVYNMTPTELEAESKLVEVETG